MEFVLEQFGIDLTARAAAGRLDPVFGREREIGRVLRVLARKTKNNPVLLGEPGVGKTAVVEGLAQRIVDGAVPPALAGFTVFSLNLGSLLAGTGYRGDFEERLELLVRELRRPGARRLLFIDELHLLCRAGRSEGGLDAGNLLKPLLARGELPCIGASTPAEWNLLVGEDPALERRFQPVVIPEPTGTEALAILGALRARFEAHHNVTIADEALEAAIVRSGEVSPDRRLPDRAIDLLDEACAMTRLAVCEAEAPEWQPTKAELDRATERFDLEAVARLRRRLESLRRNQRRPAVDAKTVAVASESGAG